MLIKHKILLILIITVLNLNIANGVATVNNDDEYIYSPEEFIQLLNSNTLPSGNIIVNNDLIIKNSSIDKLPDNFTVLGFIKLQNCYMITQLPKNIRANAISILNCPNLNDLNDTQVPVAMN